MDCSEIFLSVLFFLNKEVRNVDDYGIEFQNNK